jgi:PKD repeat protein
MTKSVLLSGLLRLAALGSLLGAGGCAYESPNQPAVAIVDPTAPFQITIGALPGAGAQAGTAAVTAHVQNVNGASLANVVVAFTTNRGTIAPANVATGIDGAASTTLSATDTADVTAAVGRVSAHTFVTPVAPTPSVPSPTPAPGPAPSPTPPPPAVVLNVPANATTRVPLAFAVSSSATGVTWNWSFGDGETAQTTGFSTTHAYATAGTYVVTVSAPGTSSASATITVTDPVVTAPAPPFAATLTCTPGNSANTNTVCNVSASYKGAVLPSSAIISVRWDWGDGRTDSSTNSLVNTHTYAGVGTFTVFANVEANAVDPPGSTVYGQAAASRKINICPSGSTSTTCNPLP